MRDGLERDNFAEREFRIAAATPPMMITLRRQEKSFHVAPKSLKQLFERFFVPRAGNSRLLGQDSLRVREVVRVAVTLKNKIEAMDGGAGRGEKLRDRVKAR